jgi:hypothetical protein
VLPLAGLATLALPVVSSLQFYAGYPLRVVTAEASRWLLGAAGFDASREGSAMLVDGRPGDRRRAVLGRADGLDGVVLRLGRRLLARAARPALRPAARLRRRDRPSPATSSATPCWSGLEARGGAVPAWQHQAIGMVVLASVCAAVAYLGGEREEAGAAAVDRVRAAERRPREGAARGAGDAARRSAP